MTIHWVFPETSLPAIKLPSVYLIYVGARQHLPTSPVHDGGDTDEVGEPAVGGLQFHPHPE